MQSSDQKVQKFFKLSTTNKTFKKIKIILTNYPKKKSHVMQFQEENVLS